MIDVFHSESRVVVDVIGLAQRVRVAGRVGFNRLVFAQRLKTKYIENVFKGFSSVSSKKK